MAEKKTWHVGWHYFDKPNTKNQIADYPGFSLKEMYDKINQWNTMVVAKQLPPALYYLVGEAK